MSRAGFAPWVKLNSIVGKTGFTKFYSSFAKMKKPS